MTFRNTFGAAYAMAAAQAKHDNSSDPRLEDDGPECFVARVDGLWINCAWCGHDMILAAGSRWETCEHCGSEELVDCTTVANRERWLMPRDDK